MVTRGDGPRDGRPRPGRPPRRAARVPRGPVPGGAPFRAGPRRGGPALAYAEAFAPDFAFAPVPFEDAANAFRALSQSDRNWTIPLSVSGWWTICWRTLNGRVATCAPASAACVM